MRGGGIFSRYFKLQEYLNFVYLHRINVLNSRQRKLKISIFVGCYIEYKGLIKYRVGEHIPLQQG